MEKIKAGKVLEWLDLDFKYVRLEKPNSVVISTHPRESMDGKSLFLGISTRLDIDRENEYEIDFSEDFSEERLSLINRISSYLSWQLDSDTYGKIEGFFEEMKSPDYVKGFIKSGRITAESQEGKSKIEKIALSEVLKRGSNGAWREMARVSKYVGFYGNDNVFLSDEIPSELEVGKGFKIYEIDHSEGGLESNLPPHQVATTDEELVNIINELVGTQNKPIFQEGDIVHVLSYSNQGELGVSTQGVVKAIKSNSFIAVEIVNGIEEIHEEKNISFTPFSIHEAGFSQVRPEREIKVGDWGFFYNKKPAKSFCYQQIYSMGDLKKVVIGVDYPFTTQGGSFYKYFSHTPPQLAEGIPNPFTKC